MSYVGELVSKSKGKDQFDSERTVDNNGLRHCVCGLYCFDWVLYVFRDVLCALCAVLLVDAVIAVISKTKDPSSLYTHLGRGPMQTQNGTRSRDGSDCCLGGASQSPPGAASCLISKTNPQSLSVRRHHPAR